MSDMEEVKIGVNWRHIVVTALATGVAAVLAIWAVIAAPVGAFPGVSGLYIAAAIYVPLSLWLGMWGSIAGYFSCVILGFVSTPFGVWSFLWSIADFVEGFIPLVAFRAFKADVDLGAELKRSKELYILLGVLVINLVLAGIATPLLDSQIWQIIWIISVVISIILIIGMYALNRSKSWLVYIIFGIFCAAIGSALIGVAVPIWAGYAPPESFWVGLIGWFAGDLIVLSAIATPLMVTLTGKIKETSIFVEKWFS
ncbi:MAG: hypothetical protein ACFFCV_03770 [Promethearchaeota archaeon]